MGKKTQKITQGTKRVWLNLKETLKKYKIQVITRDTVGDPFKDTSGPSLNILIKLVSTGSIVFSRLIVAFHLL